MKLVKDTITIIALILCIIIFGINLIYIVNIYSGWQETATISYFGIGNLAITILIAIGIFVVSNWTDRKIQETKMTKKQKIAIIAILFLIYAIIQVIWIYGRNSTPIADSMKVYKTACQIYKGEPIALSYYFELNPHNFSLSYLLAGVFKLVNNCDVIILKMINVIANCFSILGLYFILKRLKKDYAVNMSLFWILSLTYIPIILLVNYIYGDLISLPFVIFSLYFVMQYTNKPKTAYLVISSLLMTCAIMLRRNNLIFAIATIIYLLLDIMKMRKEDFKIQRNLRQLGKKIICIILFIAISVLPYNIMKNMLSKSYKLDFEKEFPATRYIAMGMHEGIRANGWYNEIGDMGWKENVTNEQYIEIIKKRIHEFSNNVFYTLKFYTKKVVSMWAEPLQESIWQNLSFNFENYNLGQEWTEEELQKFEQMDNKLLENEKTIQLYQKAFILILFGRVITFIIMYRKNLSNEAILLLVSFVGGFMFHVLWEAKSRYIIPYIVILIPLASIKFMKNKNELLLEKADRL